MNSEGNVSCSCKQNEPLISLELSPDMHPAISNPTRRLSPRPPHPTKNVSEREANVVSFGDQLRGPCKCFNMYLCNLLAYISRTCSTGYRHSSHLVKVTRLTFVNDTALILVLTAAVYEMIALVLLLDRPAADQLKWFWQWVWLQIFTTVHVSGMPINTLRPSNVEMVFSRCWKAVYVQIADLSSRSSNEHSVYY